MDFTFQKRWNLHSNGPAFSAGFCWAGTVGSAVQECRLVCECVADRLDVKGKVYAEVVEHCRSDAVFGTASASLPLAEIQALLPPPWRKRLLGLR